MEMGCWGGRGILRLMQILVAAAPNCVPEELLNQLSEGGRLIIPIGISEDQKLLCFI